MLAANRDRDRQFAVDLHCSGDGNNERFMKLVYTPRNAFGFQEQSAVANG